MERLVERLLKGGRVLAVVSGVALGLFHLRLFVDDLMGGRLADPGLALRWLSSVALVLALVTLARRGASLCGMRGIAASLLVVILHVPVMAPDPGTAAATMPVESLATVLQTAAAVAGALLLLISGFGRRRWHLARSRASASTAAGVGPRAFLAFLQPFAPRPPPLFR